MTKEKFENLDCVMAVHNGIRGFSQLLRGKWYFTEHQMTGDTHHAILLNLEEINPCLHEKEKVFRFYSSEPKDGKAYYRCNCGAEVEPAGFVEVKK